MKKDCTLKYVKGVSSVTQLSCAQPVTNVPLAVQNLPVGTSNFLANLAGNGCRSKNSSYPERGLHPPLSDPAKSHKVSHGHNLLFQSSQEQLPDGGVTSAYRQKCCRTGSHPDLPRDFQPAVFGTQTQQGTPFWSVHSAFGVHCNSKGGETDGHTQGYKNPPVPRRLVGTGHLPPRLSPTYLNTGQDVPRPRLDGKCREIRTRTQASLRLCRLPVQPPVRPGPTHTGPLAKPQEKIQRLLVLPACPVRQFMSLIGLLTATEKQVHIGRLHMRPMAPQKQLEDTGILREGHSNTQVSAPTFTMVAGGGQCAPRSTIKPNKTCSANLYRRIKRRVGRSPRRAHYKRGMVITGKPAAYKLSGTKSSIPGSKRVPRPLLRQDSPGSNRQHNGSGLCKQGRRHGGRALFVPYCGES